MRLNTQQESIDVETSESLRAAPDPPVSPEESRGTGRAPSLLHAAKQLSRTAGFRRQHAASLRMLGERQALATVGRIRRTKNARILCYHSVGTPSTGVNDVTPVHFRRHIELAL